MIDDFLVRAAVAGIGVALVAGPLGCFIVWRRMAYFGAALSHSALLGVAFGFLLAANVYVGIFLVCIATSVILVMLERHQQQLASDTLLGILAHAGLALGLVALAFMEGLRVDLMAYLFGDILAVTMTDIGWIYGGGIVGLLALLVLWRPLLLMTVHSELAEVEGVPVEAVRLAFMVIISLVVAAAMQIVGILLIVSMLIIPAAAARPFARTPAEMAALAVGAGALSVVAGLMGSLEWDTPAGPSIVVAATILFALALPLGAMVGRRPVRGSAGT